MYDEPPYPLVLTEQGKKTLSYLSLLHEDKNYGAQADNITISSAWKNAHGEACWTKWVTYFDFITLTPSMQQVINRTNNRTILKNEIVIDIDQPTREEANVYLTQVLRELDHKKINYMAYDTGSKGYHIHIFIPDLRKRKNIEEYKTFFVDNLGGDMIKVHNRVMIALENVPHWKTGRIKTCIKNVNDGINRYEPLK